ncbi:MAG TPA: helix-turn-helix domain-containing protein, partial [Actinoplanes sp.]
MVSSFGDTLRRHRLRRGLSQEELAATAHIGVRGLRNIEAGRIAAPRPATARQLADALGLAGDEWDDFVASALLPEQTPDTPSAPAPLPRPAQLPRDAAAFTGRADSLARLEASLARLEGSPARLEGEPGAVAVISGAGGVGKTALAVHWAHRAADRFPDGQLYVNLHGFGPEGSAADPGAVLADFLTALGVDRTAVPAATAARTALFRSRLAGRRVLVLLDNARDAEQVRPLLPGAGGCRAVVTSRSRLTGLIATDDAVPVPLDVLDDVEAVELLERRLGTDRVAATPDAVAAIVARCDRMPLALAIVAARAVAQPGTSMVEMAEELRDPAGALAALDIGDAATDLRTVFSWSVRALPASSRRLFALLGLHPGTDIEAYAAANLAGESLPATRRMLAELVSLHLMNLRPGGRHGMHDLVRAYAAETAGTEFPAAERAAATARLRAFYRHTAVRAGRLVHPGHRMMLTAAEPATPLSLPHHDAAALWIRAERANLLATAEEAAEHGDLDYAPTMNLSLWNHWNDHGYSAECLSISTAAVAAARRGADRLRLAYALSDMAGSLAAFGRYSETIRYGEESRRLLHDEGDQAGERLLLGNLQELYTMVGDMVQARRCAEEQMTILREGGNRIAEAETAILLSQLNLHL